MCRRLWLLASVSVGLVCVAAPAMAQEDADEGLEIPFLETMRDPVYVDVRAGYFQPVFDAAQKLGPGIEGTLGLRTQFAGLLGLEGAFFYNFFFTLWGHYAFVTTVGDAAQDLRIHKLGGTLMAWYQFDIFRWLKLELGIGGGYMMYINGETVQRFTDGGAQTSDFQVTTTFGPTLTFGPAVRLELTYSLGIVLEALAEAQFRSNAGPQTGFMIRLGVSLRLGRDVNAVAEQFMQVPPFKVSDLFAARYKRYVEEPIGVVKLQNISETKLTNVRVQFMVEEVMDTPTEMDLVEEIEAGGATSVPLKALFNAKVLEITEDTPISGRVTILFTADGESYELERFVRFRMYNRNALTWDKTQHLGAFVTPRDPPVQVFARAATQAGRDQSTLNFAEDVKKAILVFSALQEYGMTYLVDPNTPFEQLSQTVGAVDFVQYPRDTLRFKTGDCDDLVALYTAVLESLGVETAFITIPGHIFMMFDTGLPPSRASQLSAQSNRLVVRDGRLWMPVEVTLVQEGFEEAWIDASRSYYRWANRDDELDVVEVDNAWSLFEPATLPEGDSWRPQMPSEATIVSAYGESERLFAGDAVERLAEQAQRNPNDPQVWTDLGIFLAERSEYSDAASAFEQVTRIDNDQAYAFFNYGNALALAGRYRDAIAAYRRALEIDPYDVGVMVTLAEAYFEDGNITQARQVVQQLAQISPDVAASLGHITGS